MSEVKNNVEPGSVISRLRELRDNFQSDTTVDLEVPGYRGELVARYHPLPWEIIRNLALRGEKGKRNPEIAPMIAADGLANACDGLFFRQADGTLEAVTFQGDMVVYDKGLANVLGIEAETTREIVRAVFPDEMSLVSHYGELMEWQSERDVESGLAESAKADPIIHPTLSSSPEEPS